MGYKELVESLYLETSFFWQKNQNEYLSARIKALQNSRAFQAGTALAAVGRSPVKSVSQIGKVVLRRPQLQPAQPVLSKPGIDANAVVFSGVDKEIQMKFHAKFPLLEIKCASVSPKNARLVVFLDLDNSFNKSEIDGWTTNKNGQLYRYVDANSGRVVVSLPVKGSVPVGLRIARHPGDREVIDAFDVRLRPLPHHQIVLRLHEKMKPSEIISQVADQPARMSLTKVKDQELRLIITHPANERTQVIVPWLDFNAEIEKPALLRVDVVRRAGTSVKKTSSSFLQGLGFSYSKSVGHFQYADLSDPGNLSFDFAPADYDLDIECSIEPWLSEKLLVAPDGIRLSRKRASGVVVEPFFSTLFQNVASPRRISGLRIAAITDNMTATALSAIAEVRYLSRHDAVAEIEDKKPDLLFVESAWRGNSNAWRYGIGHYPGGSNADVLKLANAARGLNIPSVFWNKEDPIHFDKFIPTAQAFEHILTTDVNCVEKYRDATQDAARVSVLPFFVVPEIHNPFFRPEAQGGICFAGSFYGDRHPERSVTQEKMLSAFRDQGLVIYDRNHMDRNSPFVYPETLSDFVVGGVPFEQMPDIYKSFDWFLNVNTVTESETMYARRVPELVACGTGVITNPSVGIRKAFGDGILEWTAPSHSAIVEMLDQPAAIRRRLNLAIATIYEQSFDVRLADIATSVTGDKYSSGWQDFAIVFLDQGQAGFGARCSQALVSLEQAGIDADVAVIISSSGPSVLSEMSECAKVRSVYIRNEDWEALRELGELNKQVILVKDPDKVTPDVVRSLLVTARVLPASVTGLSDAALSSAINLSAVLQRSQPVADTPWLVQPNALGTVLNVFGERPFLPAAVGLSSSLAPNL